MKNLNLVSIMNEYEIGKIDWLEKLFQENRLEKFFD